MWTERAACHSGPGAARAQDIGVPRGPGQHWLGVAGRSGRNNTQKRCEPREELGGADPSGVQPAGV